MVPVVGVAVKAATGGKILNVAVTCWSLFIPTIQFPVPLQAPDQPTKEEFESGVAVSVTVESWGNELVQLALQEMPDGLLVTVPVPVPDVIKLSIYVLEKVADIVWLDAMFVKV